MESVKDHTPPVLFVQVYRNKNSEFASKMKKQWEGSGEKFDYYQIDNQEVFAWFETSLLHFLTLDKQKERLVEWFSSKLEMTKRIIDSL
ncbi:hypothetical protein [Peribacillus acanthi]|uniref:hypothetical protein n=1 Tax=Peribacillus acanthi TaxID=2171554 RepID=UPI000D3E51B6|nr:hypothetical protein [Peribacillus acanthi]